MRAAGRLIGDAALAGALVLVGLVGSSFAGSSPRHAEPIDARGYALVVGAAALVAVRRRWPLAVLTTVTVCTAVYLALGYVYGPILLSFMVAVYGAARRAPASRSLVFGLAAIPPMLIHLFVRDTVLGLYGVIPVCAWVLVPYSLGFAFRTRNDAAARARAEAVRQGADTERLRVAQEVHDIIGHGLAAIKMQADIALHVLAKQPGQAEVALAAISRTSSDALEELRATLLVVRRTGAEAERTPVPSLARLGELRERMAESGLYVRLKVVGRPPHVLPVAVDLTGYRVVQESLTNVLRHSGAAEAAVGIRYEAGSVEIVVSNAVAAPVTGGTGSGISGMRSRVHGLGGDFAAGPARRDRFEVQARLPLGGRT
jgi:signal transduction histidine kinase